MFAGDDKIWLSGFRMSGAYNPIYFFNPFPLYITTPVPITPQYIPSNSES